MDTKADVIIVGAGASGLAAAYELSLVGKKVMVLEARNRLGGRIHSVNEEAFSQVVEIGAEFIHGQLQTTLQLLKKAAIQHHAISGKMWEVKKGKLEKTSEFIEGWDEVIKQLKSLDGDITITAFLDRYFPDERHTELKQSVIQYVQGYDAADATKASALSLKQEWENEDEDQERIDEGYSGLIHFLASTCKQYGGQIILSQVVKTIQWEEGQAKVTTAAGQSYVASKVLLTIPLGIWQTTAEEKAHIRFEPELTDKKEAARKMGFGAVIKFIVQFKTPFWEDKSPRKMQKAGFIFSDAEIPTWWTQYPRNNGLLTGWLAGPKAAQWNMYSEDQLHQKMLQSLAYIFDVPGSFLQEEIEAYKIINWTNDLFTKGAYSYATLDTAWARNVLGQPLENTIYVAGEALYEGPEAGTVEGALVTGIETGRVMISHFSNSLNT